MNHYYFEYGGGLGDVFMQMYEGRSYNVLREMAPFEQAEVILCCHNPHATELFAHHPRRQQIVLREVPYCVPDHAARVRSKLRLCRVEDRRPNPRQSNPAPLVVFPPAEERKLLRTLTREPFVVLSASAGEPARSIPATIVETIAKTLARQRVRVIAVGRNYKRWDRFEQTLPELPNLVNMIDKLSVPAVAELVQRCCGTINCHSAIGMLGWLEKKPQLLLLDDGAWTRHFKKKDTWSFGKDFETTTWVRFEEFKQRHLDRFLVEVL
jgi:ADP-heptose:LPS heptosyltransferase